MTALLAVAAWFALSALLAPFVGRFIACGQPETPPASELGEGAGCWGAREVAS